MFSTFFLKLLVEKGWLDVYWSTNGPQNGNQISLEDLESCTGSCLEDLMLFSTKVTLTSWVSSLARQNHTPASFSLKTLSYSSVTWVSLSFNILSQIRVTCFRVKRGWSLRGGEDPGEYEEKVLISGELGHGTLRCFLLWNLFHSWWMLAETWSKQ